MKKLYYNTKTWWENLISKDFLDTRELGVMQAQNAILLPPRVYNKPKGLYEGGVVDENFNFLGGVERNQKGVTGCLGVIRGYTPNERESRRERYIWRRFKRAFRAFYH